MSDYQVNIKELNHLIAQEGHFIASIRQEMDKVIIGQSSLKESLMIALLANGHVLLEGVPGLAKTMAVKTLAEVIGVQFNRIQFTPDLLPADLIGTMIYSHSNEEFSVKLGPVFTNFILADEINRSPAKVQSALLEAMQEHQVTIGGTTYPLPDPFLVMATQNPIEQEGTYPLPEAQMDRFMLKMSTGYAQSLEEESTILTRRIEWHKDDPTSDVRLLVSPEQFLALQEMAEHQIYVDKSILDYISQIVRATREHPTIEVGASPRGGLSLLRVSRAMALIHGRDFVTPDDVKAFTIDALAHRIILNIEESLEGLKQNKVVEEIVGGIPAPLEFTPR